MTDFKHPIDVIGGFPRWALNAWTGRSHLYLETGGRQLVITACGRLASPENLFEPSDYPRCKLCEKTFNCKRFKD